MQNNKGGKHSHTSRCWNESTASWWRWGNSRGSRAWTDWTPEDLPIRPELHPQSPEETTTFTSVVTQSIFCFMSRKDFSKNTWMGSSSSHCPDTRRSPYSPMHHDATCTRGCWKTRQKMPQSLLWILDMVWNVKYQLHSQLTLSHRPNKSFTDLWNVVQQCFVKSLNCIRVHLHRVCDELDQVGNRVVSHVAPCLKRWRKDKLRLDC